MYEMWGATGVEPWGFTWAEYKRLFTGWRRHRWEHAGQLAVTLANGLLPRKDRRSWRPSDFTSLFKPPPCWKPKGDGLRERLEMALGTLPDGMGAPTDPAADPPDSLSIDVPLSTPEG